MSDSHRRLRIAALCSAACLCLLLNGCGGGAAATTTVTFRPSRPDSGASATVTPEVKNGGGTPAAAGGFGSLKGKILYGGSFTPLAPLYEKGNATKDPEVCGMEAAPNQTILVKDGGLANVFIWLDKVPKGVEIPKADDEPVIFDQKYCVFKPHVMLARVNQTVRILNSDPILHNTSLKPERGVPFNQGIPGNQEAALIYARPEKKPVLVGCDIHPWMVAYHLPLDHPFAAISGEDGTFEIPNLPSGKLEFKLWHEVGKELEKAYKVEIKADEPNTVEITVPASKLTQ